MKKILIIEDNDDIRENTAEILALANYQVITAENGKVGIEKALREKPDLIICDVLMPVLDGYGVLHLVQKNPAIHSTPFIFLTAITDRAEMRKGMGMGADDYITKPFEETELLQAIECRLKKTALLKREMVQRLKGEAHALNEKEMVQLLTDDRNVNIYKKKQLIYSEGNRPSRLYYIQKGRVKIYKINEDGKELVMGVYKEGDFLGFVALLEGTAYKEMAAAMEDVELAVIPKEDFDELMSNHPGISRQFIMMMAQHIAEQEQLLLSLAYSSLRKKVARALMFLNKKYKTSIDISRENLAAVAGTATESVIRTLGDFKNEKLIDINEGMIVIVDEKKLENILN